MMIVVTVIHDYSGCNRSNRGSCFVISSSSGILRGIGGRREKIYYLGI